MTDTTNDTETQNEDVSGLKANNADLKSRLDKANREKRDLESRLSDLEDAQAAAADNGKTEIEKLKTAHEREVKRLKESATNLETRLSELLIDNEIATAITANNVLPHFAPAVTALLKQGATLKDGVAMSGEMTLAERITEFKNSEEAKHYIAAPANSGGGSQGSQPINTSGFTKPPETADEFNKWFSLTTTNPALSNSLADQWKMPQLKV